MAKRLLALAVAIAMVAIALLVRNRLGDDEETVSADDGGSETGDHPVMVACITELEEVCGAWDGADPDVAVKVEDAGATEAALLADDGAYDAWLTFDPWPDVVNVSTANTVGEAERLVSSPLVIVSVRRNVQDTCTVVEWRCLADSGHTAAIPPADTALGLVMLGNAASGWFGRTDFASNDLTEPGFLPWLHDLETEDDPLTTLVQQMPAAFVDAVGTHLQPIAQVGLGRSEDELDVNQPSPAGFATVVLAPVGRAALPDTDDLREALDEAGWNTAEENSGLPDAGVLVALRDA